MDATTAQEIAMLRILHGASAAALDVFRVTNNRVDDQFVTDLEALVRRTKGEIERLSEGRARSS